ncbi:MAG TPA: mannosyltransferase family protein [Solirubrobacteraceae bacterium]
MSDALAPAPASPSVRVTPPPAVTASREAPSGAESAALRAAWSAFWRSRILIWAAGCLAVGVIGTVPSMVRRFDPTGISTSMGSVGNVLAAPAVRGDAIWYLRIAHDGYSTTAATRFFPLYPLLVHAGSWLTGSPVIAGVLVSMLALLAGLVIIHRLTTLELGARAATFTVELIAFAPLALFLSAVYSESLFLALCAATFYAARRGRWTAAGALGGLAALTRVTGVLLVAPVLIMFLYGPRADAEPGPPSRRFLPTYPLTPAVLWAALIPAGTVAFSGYLVLRGYGPLSFLHAQTRFTHHVLALPVVSIWDGVIGAWHQLRLGFTGFDTQTQSLVGLVALAGALCALCGVFRRLPLAYGVFIVVGLLVPLSSPTVGDPLKGLARYETVLFPLYMAAAAWALERGMRRPLLLGFGALLILFTAQFATWHIVGSQLL